ncbi:MAG TPA: LLM class F420-dependent oxidoreductase [Actinomycetota bacterium]|nr:LLM class F420-dependent oxidoreductase [Actinomycetota bacterium]
MTRLGFTGPVFGFDVRATSELARKAEGMGYTDCWTAETSGPDGFSVASAVGVSTKSLRLGIAIAPVYTRPPALMAMSALAVYQATEGRFCLGLGASSPVIVEGWMGEKLERPLTYMREAVEVVRSAFAGDKVDFKGTTATVRGFRLDGAPKEQLPIFLAALGPQMMALTNEIADGIVLYLATEEGVRIAAKACPGKEIAERIMVCPDEDVDQVRGAVRWMLTPYVAVPAYNRFIAAQGFEDEARQVADAWKNNEREKARDAVSDRLIDALVIMGSADECKERLESFREAGLVTPILAPFSLTGDPKKVEAALKSLAP